jgi:hypothetical protein
LIQGYQTFAAPKKAISSLSTFGVTHINKDMEAIPLFESFEGFGSKFVGIHCSPFPIRDGFKGTIVEDYHRAFRQILELIKEDLPSSKELIEKIDSFEDGLSIEDDSVDLVFDIEAFFDDNNIEWIFVSEADAMTQYGDNCYCVYFDNMNKVYPMTDELTEDAIIFVYNSKFNKPILRQY